MQSPSELQHELLCEMDKNQYPQTQADVEPQEPGAGGGGAGTKGPPAARSARAPHDELEMKLRVFQRGLPGAGPNKTGT